MSTRTRVNTELYPSGWRSRFGSTAYRGIAYMKHETCQDIVLTGDNLPFEVNRLAMRGGVINSDYDGGFWVATFRDYACDALTNGQLGPNFIFPNSLPDDKYMSLAIQRTNPNRPYVDIGVNILEAGDIVRQVHDWGNDLKKVHGGDGIKAHSGNVWRDLGRGNLGYTFGIAPVMSDLAKLVNYRDQVDRRIKEIKRLQGPTGLRKTVKLDTLTAIDGYVVTWQSQDVFMQSYCDRVAKQEIKGHCRWIIDGDYSGLSEASLEAMASHAVLGADLDFATLWEAMPWSWLIDYCTNAGALISRVRNIVPCQLESASLIKHSVSRMEIPRYRVDQHEMSAGHYIQERKQRYPVSAAFSAHIPFLNTEQMGILSSLAVTRR